jgi:hypothetical protein
MVIGYRLWMVHREQLHWSFLYIRDPVRLLLTKAGSSCSWSVEDAVAEPPATADLGASPAPSVSRYASIRLMLPLP